MRRSFIFTAFLFLPHVLRAQADTTSLKDVFSQFSLRDLLNVSIVTVSKQEEKIFDAPLASSVLTGDEIKAAGATSVMETLAASSSITRRSRNLTSTRTHIFTRRKPRVSQAQALPTIKASIRRPSTQIFCSTLRRVTKPFRA